MSEWIDAKDRLPEENTSRIFFKDEHRIYQGHYRNGQFVAELPPDAGTGQVIEWSPPGVTQWRPKRSEEL